VDHRIVNCGILETRDLLVAKDGLCFGYIYVKVVTIFCAGLTRDVLIPLEVFVNVVSSFEGVIICHNC
jgi:hypothetical protein